MKAHPRTVAHEVQGVRVQDQDSTIVSWTWGDGRTIVVRPRGEMRSSRAGLLDAVIRRAMAHASRRAIVDLTGITTLDDDAVSVLVRACSNARASGRPLVFEGVSAAVQQRLDDSEKAGTR